MNKAALISILQAQAGLLTLAKNIGPDTAKLVSDTRAALGAAFQNASANATMSVDESALIADINATIVALNTPAA